MSKDEEKVVKEIRAANAAVYKEVEKLRQELSEKIKVQSGNTVPFPTQPPPSLDARKVAAQ